MLLSVDIGNSHTVMGAWQEGMLIASCRVTSYVMRNEKDEQQKKSEDCNEKKKKEIRSVLAWQQLVNEWLQNVLPRIEEEKKIDSDDSEDENSSQNQNNLIEEKNKNALKIIFSCVAKPVCENFRQAMENISSHVMRIDANKKLPFRFDYQGTKTLGEDRIANAVAAVSYYGENSIVIDFGSAITFCLVTKNVYRGGVILPGIVTSLDALTQNTPLPSPHFSLQKNILGQSTEQSIERGIFFAYKGAVKELLARIKDLATQWTDEKNLCVIATGGIVEQLGFSHEFFDVADKNLTLRGLYEYYLLNK